METKVDWNGVSVRTKLCCVKYWWAISIRVSFYYSDHLLDVHIETRSICVVSYWKFLQQRGIPMKLLEAFAKDWKMIFTTINAFPLNNERNKSIRVFTHVYKYAIHWFKSFILYGVHTDDKILCDWAHLRSIKMQRKNMRVYILIYF